MNCGKCGFPMMPVYNKRRGWKAACARCGASEVIEPMESVSVEAAQSAGRGLNYYRLQDFDEALDYLTEAVKLSDDLPEYLWVKLLAMYGVRYCETNDGKYAVNFWRRELPEGAVTEQVEYKRLRREASDDLEELRSYAKAAEDIDRGLRQIQQTRDAQLRAYDVFICFKDRDAEGPTPERELCDGLYNELRDRGMQVFYSPKTLYGKFTTDFEGYIYSALKSAKLLLIVTSSRENVSSPWVASEWRRFQRWNAGEDQRLMTCMVGAMSPMDFPEELSRYQHELRAELEQLRQMATIKWISGEVVERCRIVGERARVNRAPAFAEATPAPPKPAEAKPAPASAEVTPAPPKPVDELGQLEARAQGGEAEAQFELGKSYSNGEGVARDYAEAVKWYRKAAEQGHAKAQNSLGNCYYYGRGATKDYTEAARWYRKAAGQGNAWAQYSLGWCYDKGEGVVQDYAEAVKWYRKAAEQGHTAAQNSLGNRYYNGQGVAQDYTEAAKWYRKAAEQGDADAKKSLEELEGKKKRRWLG